MIDLKYIINPLMGTIIGFGTNYIAVKMLFRPYKEIKIGKFTLPFTPGVIPKRKSDISKVLGDTISNELITNDDIKNIFLSDEIKENVASTIVKNLKKDNLCIKEILLANIEIDKYNEIKDELEKIIVNKIYDTLLKIDITNIIITEGTNAIKDKLKQSFFGNFISSEKIKSIASSLGSDIEEYIKNNFRDLILPVLDKEFSNIEEYNIEDLLNKLKISDEDLKQIIKEFYTKIIEEHMQGIFDSLNISKIIENKINDMDIKEIEKLFMIVMKKELNSIVNLGALLGFILGIINIFLINIK